MSLPILLSIPHGGTQTPPELEGRLCITARDLFYDGDPFVDRIYNLGDMVSGVIVSETARAFVDLNRSLRDMPPQNPDGLIKSSTCHRRPIYATGMGPDAEMRKILIDRYYLPYHRSIQRSVADMDLQLCLDCHSMAQVAPAVSPDGNSKERPAFCISNRDGRTSSRGMMDALACCIADSFHVGIGEIGFNDPFHGGYIAETYGGNPFPWIQVEMNRSMYLAEEWFDQNTLSIQDRRLQDLNRMFGDALACLGRIWAEG